MIVFYLFGLLAVANAAPRYFHHHFNGFPNFPHHGPPGPPPPFFDDDIFDTGRFWQGFNEEMTRLDEEMMTLDKEMMRLDVVLQEFNKRIPSSISNAGIEGDEYKIFISLPGFEEKEIAVKARTGVLVIQAVHKSEDGSEKNYIDVRTLPAYVDVTGSWTYTHGVLKIVFPVKTDAEATTKVIVTSEESEHGQQESEQQSREEIDNNHRNEDEDVDADVGLERDDKDKENELLTNEIPQHNAVEATTYAVDLKNEVEFVPVQY